jgi:NAD(P)-dependent dehydrogenase (short-subunit alcohol dehydrogenase family)
MFTKVLDEQLSTENKPVKVYAVHPGFIRSNLYSQTWYAKFVSLTMGFMFKVRNNQTQKIWGSLLANIAFTFYIFFSLKNRVLNVLFTLPRHHKLKSWTETISKTAMWLSR